MALLEEELNITDAVGLVWDFFYLNIFKLREPINTRGKNNK